MKKSSKKYLKLKKYALDYVRTLPQSEKEYTNFDFETKIHSNSFMANEYIKQYFSRKQQGLSSFLTGYMRSRSLDKKQREHLGKYYDLLGSLNQKETVENRDARIKQANKMHKEIEVSNEYLSFTEKYEDEVYIDKNSEFNGYSIEELLELFKNNKISQSELNKILSEFKKHNEKYIKSGSS